jgi:AraC family transcriptional regulator
LHPGVGPEAGVAVEVGGEALVTREAELNVCGPVVALVLMAEQPVPDFRVMEELMLIGTMATYDSQAEVSERVPHQWRAFLASHPEIRGSSVLYGGSPCTRDGKIHYLTGVAGKDGDHLPDGERLTLEAGEYATVRVDDPSLLRDTWVWLLGTWLPASGRREKNAPEFERFSEISETGSPIGAVEIWIPLQPLATS